MTNLCLHCLEEGDWTDEDKCPSCESKGHTSPWGVGLCKVCNEEFTTKMNDLSVRAGIVSKPDQSAAIADLQSRVLKLERAVENLSRRLADTGTERIGGDWI